MAAFRWIKRLWPQKLLAQMVVLVLLALVLAQGISTWLLSRAYQDHMKAHSERYFVRQFGAMIQLLEQTPKDLHPVVLRAWKRPGVRFHFSNQLPTVLSDESSPHTAREMHLERIMLKKLGQEYRGRLQVRMWLESGDDEEVREQRYATPPKDALRSDPHRSQSRDDSHRREKWGPGPHDRNHKDHRRSRLDMQKLMLAIQLEDGRWFIAHTQAPDFTPLASRQTLNFVLIASVLVLLVVVFQIRKITRPLSELARAANDLGRGQTVSPLKEEGPVDVRDTVIAFNRMNDRLQRFVSDRTRMLAALSHDLRTPMTSMRLRLELMEPGEERDRLLDSLDEIQQMSEATLAFVRQSGDVEPSQQVELGALIESLCEDLQDLGMAVECPSIAKVVMPLRPVSIKRALRNLIENAVHYGEQAQVRLKQEDSQVLVTIIDRGPGIPDSEIESVFEPFVRLEASRSRDTGGMGLGLSIARQIVRSHGGDVVLENLSPGLKVTVSLPR